MQNIIVQSRSIFAVGSNQSKHRIHNTSAATRNGKKLIWANKWKITLKITELLAIAKTSTKTRSMKIMIKISKDKCEHQQGKGSSVTPKPIVGRRNSPCLLNEITANVWPILSYAENCVKSLSFLRLLSVFSSFFLHFLSVFSPSFLRIFSVFSPPSLRLLFIRSAFSPSFLRHLLVFSSSFLRLLFVFSSSAPPSLRLLFVFSSPSLRLLSIISSVSNWVNYFLLLSTSKFLALIFPWLVVLLLFLCICLGKWPVFRSIRF